MDGVPSEAGAPTEVMTNRSYDIMARARQKWIPRGDGEGNGGEQQLPSLDAQHQEQQQAQLVGVRARKALFEGEVGGPPSVHRKGWLPAAAAVGREGSTPGVTPTSTRTATSVSATRNVPRSAPLQGVNKAGYIPTAPKEDNGTRHAGDIIPSLLDSQSTTSLSLQENDAYPRGTQSSNPRHSGSTSAQTPVTWNTTSRVAGGQPSSWAPPPASAHTPSRLSQHVQRAREKSILSPSVSETTASLPSIGVNHPSISSIKVEPGSPTGTIESRDGSQSNPAGTTAKPSSSSGVATAAGLRQAGVAGGRGHALSTQYRRAKLTVRGAQHAQQVTGNASSVAGPSTSPARAGPHTRRPIIPDRRGSEDDLADEESTLPEYHENRRKDRAEEFIAYNKRAKQNAGDVFQSKSTAAAEPEGEHEKNQNQMPENGGDKGLALESHRYLGAGGGKSPIQPLFSLDRLDLSVESSPIRQVRSRSVPPEPSKRGATSPKGHRKQSPPEAYVAPQTNPITLERNLLKGAVREDKTRDWREPTTTSLAQHESAQHPIPREFGDDNSELDEELVHIMETTHEPRATVREDLDERRPRSAPSYQRSQRKSPSASGRSKTPVSSHSRSNYVEFHQRRGQWQEPYRSSSGKDVTNAEKGPAASLAAEPEMHTKPIGDKIRTFNSHTPDQWKKPSTQWVSKSNAAIVSDGRNATSTRTSSPATKQNGIHTIRRYKGRREEEEKKEDSSGNNQDIFPSGQNDDSSVKSLRNKLERVSATCKLKGDIDQDDDDNYSVQSLREKFEQKINGSQNEDEADDEDDRSVKSLREIFESPAKLKGDHVNSLRAKFEPKIPAKRFSKIVALRKRNGMEKKSRPEMIQTKPLSEPQISSSELPDPFIRNTVTLPTHKSTALAYHNVTAKSMYSSPPFDTNEEAAILGAFKGRSINGSTHEGDRKDNVKHWKSDEKVIDDTVNNHNDKKVETAENSKLSGGKTAGALTLEGTNDESKRVVMSQRLLPVDSSRPAGISHPDRCENGTSRKTPVFHSIHSRLNQWASRRQIEKNPALLSQGPEDGKEELMVFNDLERKGSYDMTPVVGDHQVDAKFSVGQSGYNRPVNLTAVELHERHDLQVYNEMIREETKGDSQSEDDKQRVPGSHWTSKGTRNVQGEMPKVNDPKGASTDSEYSDAVTLDASIAEVSLLTNPSPIRSKESKESKEGDVPSDASTYSQDKKSEASSSQLSEAAAPLMSDSTPLRSDELSSNVKSGAFTTSAKATNFVAPYNERDEGRGNCAMMFLGSQESRTDWENEEFRSQIPLKTEPPDDHFGNDQETEGSTFPDPNWPDFGDENGLSQGHPKNSIVTANEHDLTGYGNESSRSADHGYIPELAFKVTYQDSYPNAISNDRAEIRRDISNRPQHMEMMTLPVAIPNSTFPSSFNEHTAQSNNAAASRTENTVPYLASSTSAHYRSRTPTHGIEFPKSSTVDPGAPGPQISPFEDLAQTGTPPTPKSPYRPRASFSDPTRDYGPSRNERLNRNSASSKVIVGPAPPLIKPPAVPPLPSTFDPDYEAIMESRHKMLLSRQRALQHRRTTRERSQTPLQSGFFGRTHPERMQVASGTHEPAPKSSTFLRKPMPSPIPAPVARPVLASKVQTSSVADPGTDSSWDPFALDDSIGQKTFEQLTRPSRRPREPEGSRWPSLNLSKSGNSGKGFQDKGEQQPSLYSKIVSRLGMSNENRQMTQSEAVVARIAAVRAARMRRSLSYGERDPTTLSYRQRQVMGQTRLSRNSSPMESSVDESVSNLVPGYRFYTHDDLNEPVQADEFSFSTNSNAQDYAATLAVD
jgi:hypothetical protein